MIIRSPTRRNISSPRRAFTKTRILDEVGRGRAVRSALFCELWISAIFARSSKCMRARARAAGSKKWSRRLRRSCVGRVRPNGSWAPAFAGALFIQSEHQCPLSTFVAIPNPPCAKRGEGDRPQAGGGESDTTCEISPPPFASRTVPLPIFRWGGFQCPLPTHDRHSRVRRDDGGVCCCSITHGYQPTSLPCPAG